MQYHYKYAFFEIFTILKSDFPKNNTFSDTLWLRNHGLLKKNWLIDRSTNQGTTVGISQ